LISEIRSENQLKSKIDEILIKNKNVEDYGKIIIINFEQSNSDKIQFVSDYIMNYYNKDNYNYIFIVHIKRMFFNDNQSYQRIYSIPNINEEINQIFIDNLNGPSNITLKDLLMQNIKGLILSNNKNLIDEEMEFKNSLSNFVYNQRNERDKIDILNNPIGEDYLLKLRRYMENNKEFRKTLIKKAKELIDEDEISKGNSAGLIYKMNKEKPINKNTIDIVSHLLIYIREKIFNENLFKVFEFLEHDNILTTLIELDNDIDAYKKLGEETIQRLLNKYLEVKIDDKIEYKPKFLFNYKIPGFFYFYKNLSDYLNESITFEYYNNEMDLREYEGKKSEKEKFSFHNKEKELLNEVEEFINNDQKYSNLIDNIPSDLLLEDYITFYIDKYFKKDNEFENFFKNNNKVIELLLNKRFSEEMMNPLIAFNETNIILLKIIWIESNKNYIKNILEIFYQAIIIIPDDNLLYQIIEDTIEDKNNPIIYVLDKNIEHRKEINQSYYILLSSICLSLISNDIKLDMKTIHDYNSQLKIINKILKTLDYELILNLNEIYAIDELIKIIEYQFQKGINIKNIEKIRDNLRESAINLQNDRVNDLGKNFLEILKILKEEKKDQKYNIQYYDTLIYIFLKEIEKLNNIEYHKTILLELIKEKDLIKKSNNILEQFIQSYFITENNKDDFCNAQENLLNGDDVIISEIEKNLSNKKNDENYLALRETLIYLFEKKNFNLFEK
jgi:hypothetical protein